MGKAIKKETRIRTYTMLQNFFSVNPKIDIAAYCDEFGKCIFYDVPYELNCEPRFSETIVNITFCWGESKKYEIVSGVDFTDELPKTPFTTMYVSFHKSGKDFRSPVLFDTGGGYRHMIRLAMYVHDESVDHATYMRNMLEEYKQNGG